MPTILVTDESFQTFLKRKLQTFASQLLKLEDLLLFYVLYHRILLIKQFKTSPRALGNCNVLFYIFHLID